MNILVTGGSGFIGSHVFRALRLRSDRFLNFDRINQSDPTIGNWRGEVHDLSALIRACRSVEADVLVHTAALADENERPVATYATNVMGLANVLEAARLTPVRRVVVISSQAAYHETVHEPIAEDHPIFDPQAGSPNAHYGASKAAADIISMAYHSFDGIDVRVLRLSSVYGPGMRADMYIRSMVEGAAMGVTVRIPKGGAMRRDYTYIADVVDGILRATNVDEADLSQRVFNISSGTTVTTTELAEVVRTVEPAADIHVGPGLSESEEASVRCRGRLDLTAARRDLGYIPQYPLPRGIQEYLTAVRETMGTGVRS